MRRVLVYYPENKVGMSDFNVNYDELYIRIRNELNGIFPNVGNKVWLQGIVSAISNENTIYDFAYEEITEEEINCKYDCVLLPLANCFHEKWVKYLLVRTEHIKKIKIPVYVIACGVQANSYDDLNELVEVIRKPATDFIQAVYNTGGQFALRGYFTAAFFEKLGFYNAVVTGCPSLYQMGRNLEVSNEKVEESDFRATINGSFRLPINAKDIRKSDFICQSTYGNMLYDPMYFEHHKYDVRNILREIKRGNYNELQAIAESRIHLFADTKEWMNWFHENNISFSFGSRIHGTVMPILSNVPSLLYACDARTKEMAEFFNIPFFEPSDHKKEEKFKLYDLYMKTNYDEFNKNYQKHFDNYSDFLKKCGLIDEINENNIFMSVEKITYSRSINKRYFDDLKKHLDQGKLLYESLNRLLEFKNKCM